MIVTVYDKDTVTIASGYRHYFFSASISYISVFFVSIFSTPIRGLTLTYHEYLQRFLFELSVSISLCTFPFTPLLP
ncbi:hypothetical protein GA564_15375 [Bacteroides xylanisolvens]|uniref:Uncharacterized protein n=1 Tax=Bacteroides xylanisolvens TaxID=371601 RepID=A0A4Q5D6Z5_9BACE|nr:hypothetical protein GA560_17350 [Bacteroides xylanisolvens]KAB6091026.1 hypothetical protein GA551_11625 [Bacteroides xylanisolvens]KAB6092086.1 hypothetical protein GA562_20640 [Bacteroides xylanisolvens]KAB6109974.1 hypothetical protein GA564_15375 [Bacteroides xylanisolvens]RYT13661.1 hypothetical protein EAJ13_20680 [Bacteroides xylanisolvens]